jgi:plasmid maintenance system antidote protein VapI
MPKRSDHEATMSELLREAIIETDNLLSLEHATGLNRAALRRFRDGKQSLRLDLADKLAAHFGIISRRPRRRKGAQ